MNIQLHRFVSRTVAEGPGIRACLWVQGCPIRCEDCFNQETWPEIGGESIPIGALLDWVLKSPGIEGVTFLGGEPFFQARALASLGRLIKAHGLSVVTFTGYPYSELIARVDGAAELIEVSDLLIDGPFIKSLADTSRPWVGSKNQKFYFLTDRYRHLEAVLPQISNRLEVRISPTGLVELNGMADLNEIEHLLKGVSRIQT